MKREPNRRKLTEAQAQRISEPGITWDTMLPGFGIRVGARTKVWVVAVRRPGKMHPVRLRIGRWPAMSLADARGKARGMMSDGPTTSIKLVEAIGEFLEHGQSKKGRQLRENTKHQYRRNLNGYATQLLNRRFAEITRRDVARLIREIATTSGPPTASLVRSILSRLWGWGIEVGYLDVNVVSGTPNYELTKRSRVLADDELRKFWAATKAPEAHNMIARICLWTGCRRGEAGGMRWTELVDGVWRVPGARTKNHQELVLPLAKQTRAAISSWPSTAGRDHVFGCTSPHGFGGWGDAKRGLDSRLKFDEGWSLHALRRTAETRLAKLGIAKPVRDRLLNHDIGEIAESYDQYDYASEKAASLQVWADEIDRIVGCEAQSTSS
jgi:integrase